MLALAVGLFVIFSLTLRNFLTPGNLIALVRSVSILGILRWTRIGRFVYASGDNPAAARVAGIPPRPGAAAPDSGGRSAAPGRSLPESRSPMTHTRCGNRPLTRCLAQPWGGGPWVTQAEQG